MGAWEYCSVPKCEDLKKLTGTFGPWRDQNTTEAENESYSAILTASIVLGIADFFLVVVICTIAVSWAREKFLKKETKQEQEENSEMETL